MSQPYGGYQGNDDWTNPHPAPQQQFPQQQFPQGYQQPSYQQPVYQQPVYAQPPVYQEPPRKGPNGWLIALIVLLVAAVVGTLAYLFGTGAFSRGVSEPVTSTIVQTQTRQAEQPQAPNPHPQQSAPKLRTYSNYAPDTSVTSGPFAANVFNAFVSAYKETGSTNVSVSAYSPATGKTYTMSCSGDVTVYCSGGNNARVKIW